MQICRQNDEIVEHLSFVLCGRVEKVLEHRSFHVLLQLMQAFYAMKLLYIFCG